MRCVTKQQQQQTFFVRCCADRTLPASLAKSICVSLLCFASVAPPTTALETRRLRGAQALCVVDVLAAGAANDVVRLDDQAAELAIRRA